MLLPKSIFVLAFTVAFTTSHAQAWKTTDQKISFQAGVEAYQYTLLANSTPISKDGITVYPGPELSDIRPGLQFLMNRKINKRFNLETGVHLHDIFYWYRVAEYNNPSGLSNELVGSTQAIGATIPLNIEVRVLRYFYLETGLSLSAFYLKKPSDFAEGSPSTSPELISTYNGMRETFKPAFINYAFGGGIIFKNFDLGMYLTYSISDLNKPLAINGATMDQLYREIFITHLGLTYHFQIRKKEKAN